jgi:hypothetical protein
VANAYALIQTTDGGFVIAGSKYYYDGWLMKTDAKGTVLWSRTFVEVNNTQLQSVVQTSDGGYIAVGATQFPPFTGKVDAYVVKTDPDGKMMWSNEFSRTAARALNRTEILNLGTYSTPNINPWTTECVYPRSLNLNLTRVYILQGQGWENETGTWGEWNTYGRNVTYTLSLNMIFFDAYAPDINQFYLGLSFNNTFGTFGVYTGNSVQSITANGEGCLTFLITPSLKNTVNWLDTSAFGNVQIASLSY